MADRPRSGTTKPNVGERYEYREAGARALVTVLEDLSTKSWREWRVRVDQPTRGQRRWPAEFLFGYAADGGKPMGVFFSPSAPS